jgi:hypothetical protein
MTHSISDRQLLTLRIVLGLLALYHLVVGAITALSPSVMVELGEGFYGLNIAGASTAQFVYMLKALGMYAVFTGGMLAIACWRPLKARAVVGLAALLLTMRAFTRLAFFDVAHEAFAVSWSQNLFNVGLLVAQAAVLGWGYWVLAQARGAKAFSLSPSALTSASQRLSPLRIASGLRRSPLR